jgi:nucleotide-binding universal stress UspA family protein
MEIDDQTSKGSAMSYKTILVHVDHSIHAHDRITAAAQLAQANEAHLIGTAFTGISRFAYHGTEGGGVIPELDIAAELATIKARNIRALATFDAIAAAVGVLSYEGRLVDDDPAGGLALQARYADLVVLSQTDRDDPAARVVSDIPEYVMLNGGRPVLIIPYAGSFPTFGSNALVAWDASIEATHAIFNALPALKLARKVTVAVLNPDLADGREPGSDIALYLARHGLPCDVIARRRSINIGDDLLSLAAELQSDLIVMGGYGHTRFRELLLGGVTATMLKCMTAPVLMSH